jgi:hypothetical protein
MRNLRQNSVWLSVIATPTHTVEVLVPFYMKGIKVLFVLDSLEEGRQVAQ